MFEKICRELHLGVFKSCEKLTGGITNDVFKVETNRNIYIIKKINSDNIKKNIDLLSRIEFSEHIASLAFAGGINSICALKYNGRFIQKIDNDYFLIYNYCEGKVLLTKEITIDNVKKLANQLANLHSIKVNEDYEIPKYEKNDYNKYYKLLENNNEVWSEFYKNNFYKLNEIYERAYSNYLKLTNKKSYIHRDFNRKNILWKNDVPYIIDWETATIGNPCIDFFNSAWFLTADVDVEKYTAFCSEYFSIFKIDDDIKFAAYASIIEECNWLDFSLRRALSIHSNDPQEIKLGKESIISSLTEIINYYEKIPLMIKIINDVCIEKTITSIKE